MPAGPAFSQRAAGLQLWACEGPGLLIPTCCLVPTAALQMKNGPWCCSCASTSSSSSSRRHTYNRSSRQRWGLLATARGLRPWGVGCCPSSCGHQRALVPQAPPTQQASAPRVPVLVPVASLQGVMEPGLLHRPQPQQEAAPHLHRKLQQQEHQRRAATLARRAGRQGLKCAPRMKPFRLQQ